MLCSAFTVQFVILLLQRTLASEQLLPSKTDFRPRQGRKDADVLSDLVDSDMKVLGITNVKHVTQKVGLPVGVKLPNVVPVMKPMPKGVPILKPVPIPKFFPIPLFKSPVLKPIPKFFPMPVVKHTPVLKLPNLKHFSHKHAKLALPLKKLAKVHVKGALAVKKKLVIPKLKTLPLVLKKPKIHTLKPIVHIIHKPVPVFHKVPIPKKVIIPKFFPVFKPIPVPKPKFFPVKVPVIKMIPKIVKIPKPIPVPKFVPVKKYIPLGIPVPVPKFHKFPLFKPVPFLKPFPIPVPVKVPKFVPFPVKKIIKFPKPFFVPVKIPHITKSYIKTPVVVPIPIKKPILPLGHAVPSFASVPKKPVLFQVPLGPAAPKPQFHYIPNTEVKFMEPNLKMVGSGQKLSKSAFKEENVDVADIDKADYEMLEHKA